MEQNILFLKHMAHESDVKENAINLFKSGKSKSFIAKTLKISKPTITRWLGNIETENEKNDTFLKPVGVKDEKNWFEESVIFCEEIANSNRSLRLKLTGMLQTELENTEISARVITCLSTAIERHTLLEWQARGLDFLEANRAIARVIAMGYQINDSSSPVTP